MYKLNISGMLLLTITLTVLLMTGCEESSYNESNSETESEKEVMTGMVTDMGDYTYREGVFSDRAWDRTLVEKINSDPPAGSNIVSTADQAISIATVEFEKLQQAGRCQSYSLGGVFYDIEDQVWVVWFAKQAESDDVIIVGECYQIAISKNSGEILKAWPGE